MNVAIQDAGTCLKKLSVEVPAEEVRRKINHGLRQVGSYARLPGFRPGKAPLPLLEKRFGEDVRKDVRQQLVEEAVKEAAEKHSFEVIGEPEASELPLPISSQAMNFELTVEVRPDFELPDYKGLPLSTRKLGVTDKEVDIFLNSVRYSRGTFRDIPEGETTRKGDMLGGNFLIRVGEETIADRMGATIEIGTDTILGVTTPDIAEAFTGLPGDTHKDFTFNVKLPPDFPVAEHAGKDAMLMVHCHVLKRPELPALDDEFAKSFEFDTVDQLRHDLRETILHDKQMQVNQDMETRLLDQIVAKLNFDIPQRFATRQLGTILQREAFQKYQEGIAEDEIAEFVERRRLELPGSIEKLIRRSFVTDAIAKKERIFVTEEELAGAIGNLARQRGVPFDELLATLRERNMLTQIRWELKSAKVRTFLRQKANVTVEDEALAAQA